MCVGYTIYRVDIQILYTGRATSNINQFKDFVSVGITESTNHSMSPWPQGQATGPGSERAHRHPRPAMVQLPRVFSVSLLAMDV